MVSSGGTHGSMLCDPCSHFICILYQWWTINNAVAAIVLSELTIRIHLALSSFAVLQLLQIGIERMFVVENVRIRLNVFNKTSKCKRPPSTDCRLKLSMMISISLVFFLLLSIGFGAVTIGWIGNSYIYYQDLPEMLKQLSASAPNPISIQNEVALELQDQL